MRLIGRALTTCGALLVAFFLLAKAHALVGSNVALAQFSSSATALPQAGADRCAEPDTSLWSEGRIQAFRESLSLALDPPLAVLRIPRLGLEAPVLPRSDEASLNRGLGWIKGMTRPGKRGNVGIAGHRDGFFRVLKDVTEGDVIEVETSDGSVEYLVTSTQVIEPEELHVLAPTEDPVLTLVTCYPFYFVGSAPQRFIVRAAPRSENDEAACGASVGLENGSSKLPEPQSATVGSQQPSTTKSNQVVGGMHR